MRRAKVTMRSGDVHWVDLSVFGAGRPTSVTAVAALVDEARGTGRLLTLTNTATPSREFHIDPDEVESVVPDPYGS